MWLPGDGIVGDRAVDVLRQGFEPLHGGHGARLDGLVDDLAEDPKHGPESVAQRPCRSKGGC